MKTKRAVIHIEQEGCNKTRRYMAYCSRGDVILSWEEAKDKSPLCKTCLKAMEAEKRRLE